MNQDPETRWRPTTEQVLWIIAGLAGLGLLVFITYLYEKTLWDLLKILAVPLTIGGAVPVLNRLQKDRELAVEDNRAQDEALQAYLDQMGELVVKARLPTSQAGAEVRVLARARTLTVLMRLDASRKTSVMRFLVESALVSKKKWKKEGANERQVSHQPVISLYGADLSGANLSGADLSRTKLIDADLSGAELIDAKLDGADLRRANLRRANLRDALLNGTDLIDADLIDADLRRAKLIGANLSRTKLRGADLIEADLSNARLFEAKPIDAKLNSAILCRAFLERADLSGADLSDAKVGRANLRRANLRGTKGIVNEDLEQQALTLQDAIMPNGQKYEDWLKDKEGRGQDGKNSGPS